MDGLGRDVRTPREQSGHRLRQGLDGIAGGGRQQPRPADPQDTEVRRVQGPEDPQQGHHPGEGRERRHPDLRQAQRCALPREGGVRPLRARDLHEGRQDVPERGRRDRHHRRPQLPRDLHPPPRLPGAGAGHWLGDRQGPAAGRGRLRRDGEGPDIGEDQGRHGLPEAEPVEVHALPIRVERDGGEQAGPELERAEPDRLHALADGDQRHLGHRRGEVAQHPWHTGEGGRGVAGVERPEHGLQRLPRGPEPVSKAIQLEQQALAQGRDHPRERGGGGLKSIMFSPWVKEV